MSNYACPNLIKLYNLLILLNTNSATAAIKLSLETIPYIPFFNTEEKPGRNL